MCGIDYYDMYLTLLSTLGPFLAAATQVYLIKLLLNQNILTFSQKDSNNVGDSFVQSTSRY